MRTKASFKGHPIHQMLIPFPIGFLIGCLLFDILGLILNKASFWTTGAYLCAAGIFMAVAAAVPGFVDYLFSVPPKSTAKKRATKHLIFNLTSVFIFLIALIIRVPVDNEPGIEVLALEIIGAGLLTAGGWMGGTLVTRNFLGPDHRYAHAGKWNEITVTPEQGQAVKISNLDELQINQMKLVRINDRRLVLARTESGFTVFDDSCTHRGGSLAGGVLICSTVQCLWHGSQFDVHSGQVKAGPAQMNIKTYPVELRTDGIYLLNTSL